MSFLIRQTLIYAVPLMIVALAGIFAERSGIINLALEGIMIFGAFIGVLFVRLVQQWGWFDAAMAAKDWPALQGFMVLAMAVAALKRKECGRIVLTRPVVEAGESLGYLPGTLQEKVDPYIRPLYDALFDMMDMERANVLLEDGIIEVAPLAFMRGRTLNDAFIILDEAQNTTSEQLKMFLTRLGFGSKMVITGDPSQLDLPRGSSGLRHARDILGSIEGIAFCDFSDLDVVRHSLVAAIVQAYDSYAKRTGDRPKHADAGK